MIQQPDKFVLQCGLDVLYTLEVITVYTAAQSLDKSHSRIDSQIGLDEEFLQLIPCLIRDLIGLEKRAHTSEETLPRLGKAGLNSFLILGLLLRRLAK